MHTLIRGDKEGSQADGGAGMQDVRHRQQNSDSLPLRSAEACNCGLGCKLALSGDLGVAGPWPSETGSMHKGARQHLHLHAPP